MKPSNNEKPWRDEETLRRLYHDQRMSMQEIADHFGDLTFNGIKYWMDKHGIERRSRSESAKVRRLKEPLNIYMGFHGYEYCQSKFDGEYHKVMMHRLLAVVNHSLEELDGMVVHHKNEIPWDNRPENIELMDREEHAYHHHHSDREY